MLPLHSLDKVLWTYWTLIAEEVLTKAGRGYSLCDDDQNGDQPGLELYGSSNISNRPDTHSAPVLFSSASSADMTSIIDLPSAVLGDILSMVPEEEYVKTRSSQAYHNSYHRVVWPVVAHLTCRCFSQAWESKGLWQWLVKNRPQCLVTMIKQGADRDDPGVKALLAAGQDLDSTLIKAAGTEDVSVVQKLIDLGGTR
eukprot:jgi/Chrzof1/11195/Cz05g27190.t1